MKIVKPVLFIVLFFTVSKSFAYDTVFVNTIMQRLEELQVQQDNSNYPKGLFPSYREYAKNEYKLRDDDNMFFTAVTLVSLRNVYPKLSATNKQRADKIFANAIPAFEKFKNRKGNPTYSFWQTDTLTVFPNTKWLSWFKKANVLPDDMDDTSMGMIAMNADTTQVTALHHYMQGFANTVQKTIANTYPRYRNIPAYSVWFGKNYPIDFDVCVLANVLYMVSKYDLSFTKYDSASVQLLDKIITAKEYITEPQYVSPHYAKTSIILYHVSRLMAANKSLLAHHKTDLINEATIQFLASESITEKAMLATALKNLNAEIPVGNPTHVSSLREIENDGFIFFIANMAAILSDTPKKLATAWEIGKFNYYCPAYNLALVLEFVVE